MRFEKLCGRTLFLASKNMYLLITLKKISCKNSETKQRKRLLVVYSVEVLNTHELQANTHHSKVKNMISTHGDMHGWMHTLVPGCFGIYRSQTLASREGTHCLMKLGTGGGRWHLVPTSSRPSSTSISCMPSIGPHQSWRFHSVTV